jgi:hypothetical protein
MKLDFEGGEGVPNLRRSGQRRAPKEERPVGHL